MMHPTNSLSRPIARRRALGWLGTSAAGLTLAACGAGDAQARVYPVTYSEAEWRRRLTPEQFRILRGQGTETPGSSPLVAEHRKGTFACAADGNALFASATKYDSHTGWPSFWKPLPGATGTTIDRSFGVERTEVHCTRCGGHLGHVFADGPPPTGKRYCLNGAALVFKPA